MKPAQLILLSLLAALIACGCFAHGAEKLTDEPTDLQSLSRAVSDADAKVIGAMKESTTADAAVEVARGLAIKAHAAETTARTARDKAVADLRASLDKQYPADPQPAAAAVPLSPFHGAPLTAAKPLDAEASEPPPACKNGFCPVPLKGELISYAAAYNESKNGGTAIVVVAADFSCPHCTALRDKLLAAGMRFAYLESSAPEWAANHDGTGFSQTLVFRGQNVRRRSGDIGVQGVRDMTAEVEGTNQ